MQNSNRFAVLITFLLCFAFFVSGLVGSVRAQEPEPPASTARGIQLYEQGELQSAAKVLQEVVMRRPDDADAWYFRVSLATDRAG
jgi:Flp pilus assembly protein TadD